jgi:hypothetical protein
MSASLPCADSTLPAPTADFSNGPDFHGPIGCPKRCSNGWILKLLQSEKLESEHHNISAGEINKMEPTGTHTVVLACKFNRFLEKLNSNHYVLHLVQTDLTNSTDRWIKRLTSLSNRIIKIRRKEYSASIMFYLL